MLTEGGIRLFLLAVSSFYSVTSVTVDGGRDENNRGVMELKQKAARLHSFMKFTVLS